MKRRYNSVNLLCTQRDGNNQIQTLIFTNVAFFNQQNTLQFPRIFGWMAILRTVCHHGTLKNFYRHSQYLECWIFTRKARTAHVNRCFHDEIALWDERSALAWVTVSTVHLYNKLTPWFRATEQLTAPQPVKTFPAHYAPRSFITVFTPSSARSIQSSSLHCI